MLGGSDGDLLASYRQGRLGRILERSPEPIEASLKHAGLWDLFVHVEVSATSGLAKPHPSLFDTVRQHLDTPMERILMVGDEFWADIVGGHRAGFLTALTHEYRQGPTSDGRAPEVSADRVITSLQELL